MGGVTLTGTRGCQVQVEARPGSSRGSSSVAVGNTGLGAAEREAGQPGLGHRGTPPTRWALSSCRLLVTDLEGLGPFSGFLGPVEASKCTVMAGSALSQRP